MPWSDNTERKPNSEIMTRNDFRNRILKRIRTLEMRLLENEETKTLRQEINSAKRRLARLDGNYKDRGRYEV